MLKHVGKKLCFDCVYFLVHEKLVRQIECVCKAQCGCCLQFFILCFSSMLRRCFLNHFVNSQLPQLLLVSLLFLLSTCAVCLLLRSLYFRIFSVFFLITFLSPDIATLWRIVMPGLLLGMVLSVCSCWFHMVTFPPQLVSTNFGTCWNQCFLSNFTPISLHMLKCSLLLLLF